MSKSIKIEPQVFQDLMKFYGNIFNLTPLAAKIYAYLIFDFEKKGVTFDEMVEIFSASKSSVSSGINALLKANLIKDQTKIDERKRYFVINDEYAKIRFNEIIDRMKTEIDILDRLNHFRENKDEKFNQKYEIYKSLLFSSIENIENSLRKLYDEE